MMSNESERRGRILFASETDCVSTLFTKGRSHRMPKKYKSSVRSQLGAEVGTGENKFQFVLISKVD